MNIKDLPKGSYKTSTLNINELPAGSFKVVNENPIPEIPKKDSLLKKTGKVIGAVGNALISSEKNFGQNVAQATYAATGGLKKIKKVTNQYLENGDTLLKLANKTKDPVRKQELIKQAQGMYTDAGNVGEDILGHIRSNEQQLGDAAGVMLDLFTAGSGAGKAVETATKAPTIGAKVIKGATTGLKYGAAYGASQGLQDDKDVLGVAESTVAGGAIGAAAGGVLAYGGAKAGEALTKMAESKLPQNLAKKADKIAGLVTQGEKGEQAISREVLSKIDVTGVKTQEDLYKTLAKKVEDLATKQDELLSTNKTKLKIKDVEIPIKVGEKEIKHNFVQDAISQIRDFYTKTNNPVGLEEISQLEKRIVKGEGLTVQDINDLARLHGEKLNGFNANGELASGLTKQAAENTRAGLKTTVRTIFGGKESQAIDKEITNTIRVRDLTQKQVEAVNKLKQKIQERSLGAKIGYGLGKLINLIGLGSPKGIIEAMIPRGQGFKVLNAIDIEKVLEKNLKSIQEIQSMIDKNIPEGTILKRAQALFGKKINP